MRDNLPPGVSARDIPGNRPEDEAFEMALEALAECVELLTELGADGELGDMPNPTLDRARQALRANGCDEDEQDREIAAEEQRIENGQADWAEGR